MCDDLPMKIKRTLQTFLALLFAAGLQAASDKPNIILIYTDNLGYGDLGCYGNIGIKTPRIDRLAAEGALCKDFYVVSSTCTVSRGALLTGRHPLRNGLGHQLGPEENWHGVGLPHRERILPQYLKEAGYATACFGKWNIGFASGSRPTERGFDELLGSRSGNINYFTHIYHGEYDIFQGIERHQVEGYSTDVFADAACDFIRRKTGQPFFIYLPFNAPHYVSSINMAKGEKPVWQVPGKYLERYGWAADEANEKRRYFALLTALDDAVGRVLDTLDAKGLRENTLVIFTSDMGAILRPTHGFNAASNFPFRDGAPSMYEGGIRVPAIFRWPGKIKPGVESAEVLSHLDLLPLCLGAAGLARPKDRILDGHDPLPALKGDAKSPYPYLVSHLTGAAALRDGRWKIVRPETGAPWELYDLVANPVESMNLAAKNPDDLRRLTALYAEWEAGVKNDASEPVRYKPGPKAAAQSTKLPAKDKFHLFLLIGQSNMAGRGLVEPRDKEPHLRVLMLDKDNAWVPAVDPMHFDKPGAGVGPGRTFGMQISEANAGITVGLIPCAVGGSPIDTWRPNMFYAATKSHPWDDAMERTAIALKAGSLRGILWHQGENDSLPNLAEAYEARLHDLIARLRKELNAPDVPFIAGQMGKFADMPWKPEKVIVDKAHQELPNKVPHTAVVSSEGLNHQGDKVHFDSASYRELGKRYAEAFLRLSFGK